MSSNNNEFSHLIELGNSKYEVATGESDIRNWVVKNENGNILGEVQDLIFDSKERKVKFIVLDLDRNELNLKERKVLLPVEYAEINEAYKNVVYRGLMPNELATLPTYEKGKITRNSLDLTTSTFITSMGNEKPGQQPSTGSEPASFGWSKEYLRTESSVHPDVKLSNNHGDVFYTVIGAFDQPGQTQAAIEYLLNHGFRKDEITVSTRQEDVQHDQNYREESGISHVFKSLFSNDEEAGRYAEAAARGSVVTVDVTSPGKAEEAAKILDQHGSLNINEIRQPHSVSENQKGASRIFERRTGR